VKIQIPPAEVKFADKTGVSFTKKSNPVLIKVKPNHSFSERHLIVNILMLLAVSFALGSFGSVINWLNSDKEIKEERENNEIKIWHHALLGGAAGVLILASFQGLSVLFSEEQLKITSHTIIVLIAAIFSAGFAPVAIIEKMTRQLKIEKESAKITAQMEEEEKESVKNKMADTENTVEEIEEKFNSQAEEYEEKIQQLLVIVEQLKSKET